MPKVTVCLLKDFIFKGGGANLKLWLSSLPVGPVWTFGLATLPFFGSAYECLRHRNLSRPSSPKLRLLLVAPVLLRRHDSKYLRNSN